MLKKNYRGQKELMVEEKMGLPNLILGEVGIDLLKWPTEREIKIFFTLAKKMSCPNIILNAILH